MVSDYLTHQIVQALQIWVWVTLFIFNGPAATFERLSPQSVYTEISQKAMPSLGIKELFPTDCHFYPQDGLPLIPRTQNQQQSSELTASQTTYPEHN